MDLVMDEYGVKDAINTVVSFLFKWNEYYFAWIGRSSRYNPIFCPAVSTELRCFEIPCCGHKQGSVSRKCADPGCQSHALSFCWTFVCWTLVCCVDFFVDFFSGMHNAHNPDIISSVTIQKPYRTFDVIKSIALECVRAQQVGSGSKYDYWKRSRFTEQ